MANSVQNWKRLALSDTVTLFSQTANRSSQKYISAIFDSSRLWVKLIIHFQMEQRVGNLKDIGVPVIELCFPQIWCSSSIQLLELEIDSLGSFNAGRCVESSITQPRVARFCRNLLRWCTMDIVIKGKNDWQNGRPQMAIHR